MEVVREIAPCLVADEKNIFLYLEPAVCQEKDCDIQLSNKTLELFRDMSEYKIEHRILRLSVNDFSFGGC
jgi:hypothetical protein